MTDIIVDTNHKNLRNAHTIDIVNRKWSGTA